MNSIWQRLRKSLCDASNSKIIRIGGNDDEFVTSDPSKEISSSSHDGEPGTRETAE